MISIPLSLEFSIFINLFLSYFTRLKYVFLNYTKVLFTKHSVLPIQYFFTPDLVLKSSLVNNIRKAKSKYMNTIYFL